MTYSSGGLIQASDYNTFNGAATANVSGTLCTVYATGKGNAGYGQTAVANVTAAATVTATQWTTLVNAINVVRKHQSGAGFTNIGTYTAGTTINATNDVSGNLTTAYTNRVSYAAEGTTTTGANLSYSTGAITAANNTAYTFSWSRTATFANADAARYFFNAGGQLNYVITGINNVGGTSRGNDFSNVMVSAFASKRIRAANSGARTGTGGTLTTDLTTDAGYYGLTTSNTTLTEISSTSTAYTGDIFKLYGKTNGVQGSNDDNGTVLTFSVDFTSGAQAPIFNDNINVVVYHRIDVIYPSTSFLANTWGTVTIA